MNALIRRCRALPLPAVLLAALCMTGANAAPTPGLPFLPLAAPPAANNQAASTIFDAMLAISRAVATNPAAAQAAAFPYAAAIQRYNAGDLTAARQAALQAISAASTIPFVPPNAGPAPIPLPIAAPNRIPMLLAPAQADAEEFLALARRALIGCAVPQAQQTTLRNLYQTAVGENTQRRWQQVRIDAKAIIDGCAAPQPPVAP